MPKFAQRLLLFASGFRGALALEDTSAQVQTRVGALAGQAPEPDVNGVTIKREAVYLEPGAAMRILVGENCTEDGGALKTCSVRWGKSTGAMFQVKLPGGLLPGDTLVGSVSGETMLMSPAHPLASVIPATFDVTGKCQICDGSCSWVAKTELWKYEGKMPSFLYEAQQCANRDQEEYKLLNLSLLLPDPGDLMLEATAKTRVSLKRSDGTKRVEGSYETKIKALPPSGLMAAAAPPQENPLLRTLVNHVASSIHDEALRQGAKFPAQPEPPRTAKRATGKGFVQMDLDYTQMGSGIVSSLDVKAGDHCQRKDTRGSLSCKVPLVSSVTYSIKGKLTARLEEGTHLMIHSNLSVGGDSAAIIQSVIPEAIYKLPACGEPQDIIVFGHSLRVYPPQCGDFEFSLESLEPTSFFIPDIATMELPETPDMPIMPKTVGEMFPLKVFSSVDVVKPDGTRVYAFTYAVTLGSD